MKENGNLKLIWEHEKQEWVVQLQENVTVD